MAYGLYLPYNFKARPSLARAGGSVSEAPNEAPNKASNKASNKAPNEAPAESSRA
jgi:hypothetical protein